MELEDMLELDMALIELPRLMYVFLNWYRDLDQIGHDVSAGQRVAR
jgi:hypothetical protein